MERIRRLLLPLALTGAALLALAPVRARGPEMDLARQVEKLTRAARWRLVASLPVQFPTHHPQGLVKIGETFFVSSVEVTTPARRLEPGGRYDRDEGAGVGHLFKFDAGGRLLADLTIGEGAMYHPGGMDYDGRDLWVPVAEYRPDSRAIVYRVDPAAMRATEVLRFPDHLGAVVHNTDDRTLHGVSWGSRRFYRWPLDRGGRVSRAAASAGGRPMPNRSHYVDYQDCKYARGGRMLCTGVTELRQAPGTAPFRLGGMDLVDLRDGRPIHQVPILLWTAGGLDMTHNPVWVEPRPGGLRAWFMPEDGASTLYTYDADLP